MSDGQHGLVEQQTYGLMTVVSRPCGEQPLPGTSLGITTSFAKGCKRGASVSEDLEGVIEAECLLKVRKDGEKQWPVSPTAWHPEHDAAVVKMNTR